MEAMQNNDYNIKIRNEKKIERFDTVNDMDDDEMEKYKNRYFEDNLEILSKYLNYFDRAVLDQTLLGRVVNRVNSVLTESHITWVYSNLRYGRKNVFVPIDFYTLTETILSINCRVKGIFRVKNSIEIVKECVDVLKGEIKKRTRFETIRNRLAEQFNIIDLTTAFKEIIRNYKYTVIPQNYIPLCLKLSQLEDKRDQMIIYHYFYISLPKFNRHLLEATVYFLYLIHDIATDRGSDNDNNMNMEGISTVMMPNLLLKDIKDADLNTVPLLVEFTKQFILNFPDIIKVNPEYE